MRFSEKQIVIRSLCVAILMCAYGTLMAQSVKLPDRMVITDKYYSAWGTNVFYEYEFARKGKAYKVVRKVARDSSIDKKYKRPVVKVIPLASVEAILHTVHAGFEDSLIVADFVSGFPEAEVRKYVEKGGLFLETERQRKFMYDELTDPEKLRINLVQFYKRYNAKVIDGAKSMITVMMNFKDSTVTLATRSSLPTGLPVEINGRNVFSPALANQLADLMPEGITQRPALFQGERLFSGVAERTVQRHHAMLRYLAALEFQPQLDSLSDRFNVSDVRVVQSSYSTSWNGEKRFACTLVDVTKPRISVQYSTPVTEQGIQYPVSNIINAFSDLYNKVYAVTFFRKFLEADTTHRIELIYNGKDSFTEKAQRRVLESCKNISGIDFEHSIYVMLRQARYKNSFWVLLPSGQFFFAGSHTQAPDPGNDSNYLRCSP